MAEPLGLTRHKYDLYVNFLLSPHDFDLEIDVLTMEENHVSSIRARRSDSDGPGFTDGQVNLQSGGTIKRTATLYFFDPDHSLHLDSSSPFEGAIFADRMIRVRHVVNVPGAGTVRATPIVGVVVRVLREGDVLTVEVQDKTLLAVEGCRPKRVKKGRNAVDAIRAIMEDCTGERRFRFPKGHKARLSRSYTVGWKAEASPWAVCQKIANSINMQLVYACDGALLLRHKPDHPIVTVKAGGALTGSPRSEYDMTSVRNYVKVTGRQDKKKDIHIGTVAHPKPGHPMSPQSLGRHGSPRFLPALIDDSSIRKESVAKTRAKAELAARLPLSVALGFPTVPFFHLDYGDPILLRSPYGDAKTHFVSGSIPLGLGGDATVGDVKSVSRPRRRSHG